MEQSPNQYTQPIGRFKRLARLVFDRHLNPEPSDRFRQSAQIDVGKTASKAAEVQAVIEGINNQPQLWSDFHPTISVPHKK